ncbi:uncharacterized protein TM35_000811030, partial [Trypanosoma theileri]
MLLRFVLCVITLLVSIGCACVTAAEGGGASALATPSQPDSDNCIQDSTDGSECPPKRIQPEDHSKNCEGSTAGDQCPKREEAIESSAALGREDVRSRSSALEARRDGLNNGVSQNGANTLQKENEAGKNLVTVDRNSQTHEEVNEVKPPLPAEETPHRGPNQSEAHVQVQAQQSAQEGVTASPQTEEISTVVSKPTNTRTEETSRNDNTLNTESSPPTNPQPQENSELQSSVIASAETPASTSPAETENTNASDNTNAGSASTPAESESSNNQEGDAVNTATTTTTTTTTTTIPPELTNNKKGDA